MPNFIDLTGKKFGRLHVLVIASEKSPFKWFCKCDCGNFHISLGKDMKNGKTQSCGCLAVENGGHLNKKHGLTKSLEYQSWSTMKMRCNNPNRPKYKDYGGRGITFCDEWNTFENFYNDMGPRPSKDHTLDRIDVNGNYEPGNCRWATKSVQSYNQRGNKSNTSGVRGVRWSGGGWTAQINRAGVKYYLGHFTDFEDAVRARKQGEIDYWG